MRLTTTYKFQKSVDNLDTMCYNKYRIKRGASTTDNWGVVDLTKPVAFWLGVCNPSKTFQKNQKNA